MNDRETMRNLFFSSWQKYLRKQALEPLEAQIVDIILNHPEYHALLAKPEEFLHENFGPENPFLHMSLHLALTEQISTDRPKGIKKIYHELCQRYADPLKAQHSMIEVLSDFLWQAQSTQKMPDESAYLDALKRL